MTMTTAMTTETETGTESPKISNRKDLKTYLDTSRDSGDFLGIQTNIGTPHQYIQIWDHLRDVPHQKIRLATFSGLK